MVVVVGAGFSAALTGGAAPMIGSEPLPTLRGFAERLLAFSRELPSAHRPDLPFSGRVLRDALAILEDNQSRPEDERYDFEQLISLVEIRRVLFTSRLAEQVDHAPPGVDPAAFRCLLALTSLLIAKCIGLTSTLRCNRNYWYRVQDAARAITLRRCVRQFATENDVTFISFNYDGLLEACLDFIGQMPPEAPFLYVPERSHGVPLVMPEHFGGGDDRRLSGFLRLTTVLKPHGSIHFFRLRPGAAEASQGTQIVAVHPRLDTDFDPTSMQRDIPDLRFWDWADPVPLIVPPLLNKESFLSSDYFQEILSLCVEALRAADTVISIGFSLPRSDLHACAAFELVDWSRKRFGLCYLKSRGDTTDQNWQRVARGATLTVLGQDGVPTQSESDIESFWKQLTSFAKAEPGTGS